MGREVIKIKLEDSKLQVTVLPLEIIAISTSRLVKDLVLRSKFA